MAQSIFLVGLMGVGKTSVGRKVGLSLKRAVLDSDKVIEERSGVPISWIFDLEGEAAFRVREQAVIDDPDPQEGASFWPPAAVAVLRAANRRMLRSRGCVVYLNSTVEQLLKRIGHSKTRPLLEKGDPKEPCSGCRTSANRLSTKWRTIGFRTEATEGGSWWRKLVRTLRSDGVVR